MTIKRSGSQPSQRAPAEHFTGTARVDPLFQPSPPRARRRSLRDVRAVRARAIQESLDGKAVEWLEKVSDEQYEGRS